MFSVQENRRIHVTWNWKKKVSWKLVEQYMLSFFFFVSTSGKLILDFAW